MTLNDIEQILRTTLKDSLNITSRDYKVRLDQLDHIFSYRLQNFSVVLVIPDFYDRTYVRHWVNILLVSMGFKQLCAQQVCGVRLHAMQALMQVAKESLAATYGAGISSACVVDIGAKITSIACVDEGLVVADSRYDIAGY